LELSEKKTQYIRNEIAYQKKSKAKLKHVNGEEISELPLNNPFKVLGVWFTTNGDWKYHKDKTITSILRKKFRFQGPTGWEDWFTLNTKDFGGLNLANVR
jgi:hypothetical protein